MSQALLESVQIPCKLSDTKEWYNVDLVEKLLQILFSACQHGSKIRLVTLDAAIDMLKVNNFISYSPKYFHEKQIPKFH